AELAGDAGSRVDLGSVADERGPLRRAATAAGALAVRVVGEHVQGHPVGAGDRVACAGRGDGERDGATCRAGSGAGGRARGGGRDTPAWRGLPAGGEGEVR